MEAVQSFVDPLEKYLTIVVNTLNKVGFVKKALDQAQENRIFPAQKKEHIVGAVISLLSLIVCFVFGLRGLGYLCGFVIPFFESWKAIKSEDLNDDRKWLIYWVVYSFITTLEGVSDVFLSWIPFYEVLKTVLYVSLWHERTEGAQILLEAINKGAGKIQAKVASAARTEELTEQNDAPDNKKIH